MSLRPVISKTAQDRDLVLTGHRFPPQPYIKAVKKFTWRICALSECLLVSIGLLAINAVGYCVLILLMLLHAALLAKFVSGYVLSKRQRRQSSSLL